MTGKLVKRVTIPGIDDELSPSWSPDENVIAFEGVKDGVTDIFTFNLATGAIKNLTQDSFFDSNPAWSPDGTQVLYNRRIGPYTKIFMVDANDPARKVELTFGDSDDLQPSFSRDAKTIYYTSDKDGEIYNLYALALESGDVTRLTSLAGGAFNPLELPEEGGHGSVAYAAYTQGRLRVYRMNPGTPEAVQRAADQVKEPPDLQPFEPPLRLTLDEAAKVPYDKIHFHIENAPTILVGVANDGTVLGNAQVLLSDLLGDRRMLFNFQSVSTFSNFYFQYMNMKNRLNWGAFAVDYRDYYIVQSATTGSLARETQASSSTGGGVSMSWPFNRYYRFGAQAGYFKRSISRPFFTDNGTVFDSLDENFPFVGWSIDGDTTRYKEWGPYHGQRYQVAQQWAPVMNSSGDTGSFQTGTFLNTSLDYRLYRHVTARSLFALRVASYISQGDGYSVYSLGGLNYLRGYDFREMYGSRVAFANLEFRFPLVDALAFPIGVLRDIRGFFFFDVGSAWFGGGDFAHPQVGFYLTPANNGVLNPFVIFCTDPSCTDFVRRKFSFWDSKNDELGDGRASYGTGFNVWLGPFQLTWAFARQFENTIEVCDVSGDGICNLSTDRKRIPDPNHKNGTVSQFYIAIDY